MKNPGMMIGPAPFAFEVRTTAATMRGVALCMAFSIAQSSLGDGFRSFLTAIAALVAAVLTESAIDALRGKVGSANPWSVSDGSVFVTALALCLVLPNRMHPAIAAIGSVLAVGIVKHSFGGLGANWLNPALGAWLVLRFTWPAAFSSALESSPESFLAAAVSKGIADPGGSPLALLKIAGWKPSPADIESTARINEVLFSSIGVELPTGYVDLFFSTVPGLIAERGTALFLIGSIVLIAARLVRWAVPFVFVSIYLLWVRVFGGIPYGGGLFSGDMLYALFSGAVLPAAFIFSADPCTGTKTRYGAILVPVLTGTLAFFFRFIGNDPYGAVAAVPVVNLFALLWRTVERRMHFTTRRVP